MAWIKSDGDQSAARILVKGADNRESYELEAGGEDNLIFVVREDGNESSLERYEVSTDGRVNQEWIHVAGSYDGNDMRIYINGALLGTESVGSFTLSQDTNDLAFGNRSDDTNREFEGSIDDVRLYGVALSDTEVAHIATEGTGYVPLISIANLHDSEPAGQKAVNFRDYAELMLHWLEEKLWPL